MKKLYISIVVIVMSVITPVVAQENKDSKVNFKVSGDLVSSYVWRGAYNAGASLQSTLGFDVKGFSITAWGSKEIADSHKEIDLTLGYSIGNFSVAVTDYWWEGDLWWNKDGYDGSAKYFNFNNHTTAHRLEGTVAYTVCEKFPLSIAWNTMFWGADRKADGDGLNYSSYVELNYPFSVKTVNLNATLGFTPYESPMYETTGFAVCNVALNAIQDIKITKSFTLPIFAKIIFNPAKEDAHLVFGMTFKY